MVKKWKIKKKNLVVFCFLFVFFLFFLLRSKSYEITYSIDDIEVTEKYEKKEQLYTFLLEKGEQEFVSSFEYSFIRSKGLISNIEVKEEESTICLIPKSKRIEMTPVCMQEGKQVSYSILQDSRFLSDEYFKKLDIKEESYQNINYYYLNDKKYFLWNYKGFYVLDKKGVKEIPLFNNDIYNIPLSIQGRDFLLVADYESKYEFNKFYIILSKNNKVKEIVLEKNLPFDSYFLGSVGDNVYLIDKKNKIEYEINPKKLTLQNITKEGQGKIYTDNGWETVTMNSLVNNEKSFDTSRIKYELVKNTLYRVVDNHSIQLSNKKVKKIVYQDKTTVYYLVDDSLYLYQDGIGEVLVMSNFEWNFNYENMIYIF